MKYNLIEKCFITLGLFTAFWICILVSTISISILWKVIFN